MPAYSETVSAGKHDIEYTNHTDMIIGSGLIFIKDLDSTNSHASRLIQQEMVPEGTVIHTNYQSAGKGQRGNKWESEDGKNLLLSIVLYPDIIKPSNQFVISMAISLGICDFLNPVINRCSIKWPNDIYADNDKIAGILIENSVIDDRIMNTVVGIGLNINQTEFPGFFPKPVSLKILTRTDYDTGSCLKQLLGKLDKRYKKLISGKMDEIKKDYISSLYRHNEWHNFKTGSGYLNGRIISVSEAGCLLVEDRQGNKHEFSFKEIEFIP